MTRPGASFLSLMTRRVLPPADSSLTSAMPSIGAGLDELLDAGRGGGDRRLVGHLGDDDLVAAAAALLLDLGHGPQADRALAGAVGVEDPLAAHDQRAGGEVGALDELHEVVGGGVGVVDQVDGGVDDLAQVVGRDVGGHAHGDALAAVDQQVREPRPGARAARLELARVVVVEVDGVLVDAVEHAHRQRCQPALGVAGRGGAEVGEPKLPWPSTSGWRSEKSWAMRTRAS